MAHNGSVVEVLRETLEVLVLGSLGVVAAYVAFFVAVTAWALLGSRKASEAFGELEKLLAGISAPDAPERRWPPGAGSHPAASVPTAPSGTGPKPASYEAHR